MSSATAFPTRQLGSNGPLVSAIGLGTMGIGAYYGKTDKAEAFKTLAYAADHSITFWDTADLYGNTEEILGDWFSQTGRRSEIFLCTKFGARDLRGEGSPYHLKPNSRPSYIRWAFERSMSLLKTDYIDLYYQHRVDPDVPIEIVMEALRPYIESGQIKWLGLSECSASTLRRAKAVKGVGDKLVAVQMEYSPFDLDIEKNGFMDTVKETGVSVIAYSPLGRGLITGKYRSQADFDEGDYRRTLPRFSDENFVKNLELVDHFRTIAERHNATPSQIALAWILADSNFIPIPGTRNVERLQENARGAEINLTAEDVKVIRTWAEEADIRGERKRAEHMSSGMCIELSEWNGE